MYNLLAFSGLPLLGYTGGDYLGCLQYGESGGLKSAGLARTFIQEDTISFACFCFGRSTTERLAYPRSTLQHVPELFSFSCLPFGARKDRWADEPIPPKGALVRRRVPARALAARLGLSFFLSSFFLPLSRFSPPHTRHTRVENPHPHPPHLLIAESLTTLLPLLPSNLRMDQK